MTEAERMDSLAPLPPSLSSPSLFCCVEKRLLGRHSHSHLHMLSLSSLRLHFSAFLLLSLSLSFFSYSLSPSPHLALPLSLYCKPVGFRVGRASFRYLCQIERLQALSDRETTRRREREPATNERYLQGVGLDGVERRSCLMSPWW